MNPGSLCKTSSGAPMSIKQVQVIDRSKESLVQSAAGKLNDVLRETSSKEVSILLLLSGGSSLALLDNIDYVNLGSQVTVTVLDERYSANPSENNMAQIASSKFYIKAKRAGCGFIDTRVQNNETQEQLASRFNNDLVTWIRQNPTGKIIATVGIGEDGHVSGIMPYPEDSALFNRMFDNKNDEELITSYDASGKNPYPKRVTTNINLIRKIDTAISYVIGENKKEALKKINDQDGSLNETPARVLREIKGSVFLFTDQ